MSSTKHTKNYTVVNAHSLASSFTSSVIDLTVYDRAFVAITTTGTPTGQVSLQGSADKASWTTLPLSIPALSGAADSYFVDITASACPFLRIVYTATSGTGTLTAVVSAKES